jgi:hypothetical protein
MKFEPMAGSREQQRERGVLLGFDLVDRIHDDAKTP